MTTEPEVPLPPVQTALLDAATFAQLLADVEALGGPLEVLVKWRPEEHTAARGPSLAEARSAVEQGRALGLQLRYTYQGCLWMDTLMRTEEGLRLVRIAHPLNASPR